MNDKRGRPFMGRSEAKGVAAGAGMSVLAQQVQTLSLAHGGRAVMIDKGRTSEVLLGDSRGSRRSR